MQTREISRPTLIFCFGLIAVLLFGILFARKLSLPLSSFTLFCAFCALMLHSKGSKTKILECLKVAPFGVVVFSLGLFVVVFGLKNDGALEFLIKQSLILSHFDYEFGIFGVGLFSSLGSSVINNLPMVMFGNLALENIIDKDLLGFGVMNETLIFAHLLGCNVGAKLTPLGSLATLLWLESLKSYQIRIGFLRYTAIACCVTVPVLFAVLCVGWFWEVFVFCKGL